MAAQVTFKAKVQVAQRINADWTVDNNVRAIDVKQSIGRSDCNLRPHQHMYYNCDMFPSMLRRAVAGVTGGKGRLYLDALPDGVVVDESGFLAKVTITLPESFG